MAHSLYFAKPKYFQDGESLMKFRKEFAEKVKEGSMVLVDKPMPEKCAGCWAMRCSKCIISNSKSIQDYQANGTKPDWCPIIATYEEHYELKTDKGLSNVKKQILESVITHIENEIDYLRDIATDEWFKGQIHEAESIVKYLKERIDGNE